jgi:hypothetical protein
MCTLLVWIWTAVLRSHHPNTATVPMSTVNIAAATDHITLSVDSDSTFTGGSGTRSMGGSVCG